MTRNGKEVEASSLKDGFPSFLCTSLVRVKMEQVPNPSDSDMIESKSVSQNNYAESYKADVADRVTKEGVVSKSASAFDLLE